MTHTCTLTGTQVQLHTSSDNLSPLAAHLQAPCAVNCKLLSESSACWHEVSLWSWWGKHLHRETASRSVTSKGEILAASPQILPASSLVMALTLGSKTQSRHYITRAQALHLRQTPTKPNQSQQLWNPDNKPYSAGPLALRWLQKQEKSNKC